MQFIFGSDKDKGYGMLFTDGKPAEAERIKTSISLTVEAGVDSFGFMGFGTNHNRPLFFRIKKDFSYNREAYYIHGIYRDAYREYFAGGDYEKDMYLNFIQQEQVDAIRAGEAVNLNNGINPAIETKISLEPEILKELLLRLYQGEKLLLSVADDVYSNDYAIGVMREIFAYLPPSLRKSCGYITGVVNVGSMKDIKIRIVPASMLKTVSEPAIDITAHDFKCGIVCDFNNIIEYFLSTPEIIPLLFKEYEIISSGYNSYYQPKKFLDFWKAVHGDVAVAEKMFDVHVDSLVDPTSDDVPNFIKKLLGEKLNNQEEILKTVSLPTVDSVINTKEFQQKQSVLLKKLYLLNSDFVGCVRDIYNHSINQLSLDVVSLQRLKEAMEVFQNRSQKETKGYICEFEKGVEDAFKFQLGEKVAKSMALYLGVDSLIKDAFAKMNPEFINDDYATELKKYSDLKVSAYYAQAEALKFDIKSFYKECFIESLNKHNEAYPKIPDYAADLARLEEISKDISDKKKINDNELAELVVKLPECMDKVEEVSIKYASGKNISEKSANKRNPVFLALSTMDGMLSKVAKAIVGKNPFSAIYLLTCYAKFDEAYNGVAALILNNGAAIATIDKSLFKNMPDNIGTILSQKMFEENVDADAAATLAAGFKDEFKALKGRDKALAAAVIKAVTCYCKGKAYPAGSGKKLAIIISASVALVLIITGVVLAIVLSGGDDDKDSGKDKDETSVVDDSSNVSDNNSDVSDNESNVNGDSSGVNDNSDSNGETSEPETSEPETSEPETSEPETSEPETSEPETSEPETSEPETSEPETSEPETSEPETSEPETSEPETSEPETSEPETSEPETSEPETSEPETSEPETSEPETSEPETSEPETSEPETPETETSAGETLPNNL